MRTIWQTRGGRSASSSRCPINLRSGYYAAKLETTKNQYRVFFFVRPKEGRPTADIAFLVPTFSYPAYSVTGPTEFSSTALSQYSRLCRELTELIVAKARRESRGGRP